VILKGAALTGARPHLARAADPVPLFKKASLKWARLSFAKLKMYG